MADTQPTHPAHSKQDGNAPKNDFAALLSHVQTHPWTYIGAALFVVAVLVITGAWRLSQRSSETQLAGEFARALDLEDPAARAAALAKIADAKTGLSARALYMQGESALEAGDREAARKAFIRLRESYPDFEFVPEAVEGLGLIAEDAGSFASARGIYEEVATKWPNSSAAQRQPLNIARCLEGEKDLPSAITRYREQLEKFPSSTIAQRVQLRLTELRAEHPELFPAESAQVVPSTPAGAATPAAPAKTPDAQAPAAPAGAQGAPAAGAPAASATPAPSTDAKPAEKPAEPAPAAPK